MHIILGVLLLSTVSCWLNDGWLLWSTGYHDIWFYVDHSSRVCLLVCIYIGYLVQVRLIDRGEFLQVGYSLHLANGIIIAFLLGVDIIWCIAAFEMVSLPLFMVLLYIGYTDRRLLASTLMGIVTCFGSIRWGWVIPDDIWYLDSQYLEV